MIEGPPPEHTTKSRLPSALIGSRLARRASLRASS